MDGAGGEEDESEADEGELATSRKRPASSSQGWRGRRMETLEEGEEEGDMVGSEEGVDEEGEEEEDTRSDGEEMEILLAAKGLDGTEEGGGVKECGSSRRPEWNGGSPSAAWSAMVAQCCCSGACEKTVITF